MANTIITPDVIAKEALAVFENNTVMGNLVDRQYTKEFVKKGEAIRLRKPVKFRSSRQRARVNSDVTETTDVFTVATQSHVSWNFDSAALTMSIEEYSKRYIQNACIPLANDPDYDLCGLYKDLGQSVGTPGTTPATFGVLNDGVQKLHEAGCPVSHDGYKAVVDPAAYGGLADGLKGTYAQKPATDIHVKGYLGTVSACDVVIDQNIIKHTTGAHGAGSVGDVDGASQVGTSLVTDGWANSTAILKIGDIITIPGVYAVNPVNGVSTGALKQLTMAADVTSSAAGAATLTLAGTGIVTSGAYQTVTASPADDAVITVVGTQSTTYPQNLIFKPECFGLVVCPVFMPANVWGARETYNNLSIRVVKWYDGEEDQEKIRLDIIYGVKTLNPEMGVRMWG